MSEHTPGPWRLSIVDDVCGDNFVLRMASAIGSPCEFDTAHEITLYEDVDTDCDDQYAEISANAHLIAAAPDLLASVRELYKTLLDGMTADYDEMTAQLGRARVAIAKAEGHEVQA